MAPVFALAWSIPAQQFPGAGNARVAMKPLRWAPAELPTTTRESWEVIQASPAPSSHSQASAEPVLPGQLVLPQPNHCNQVSNVQQVPFSSSLLARGRLEGLC